MQFKVFDYIPELDCFVVRDEFVRLMDRLRLTEWTPVVWICRLLALDNDFGEHIFDNWKEREAVAENAAVLGYGDRFGLDQLMIVVADRFADHEPYCIKCSKRIGRKAVCPECGDRNLHVRPDGPCHSDAQRKRFWTDVFKGLTLDLETIFHEARETKLEPIPDDEESRFNLEEEIAAIKREYSV